MNNEACENAEEKKVSEAENVETEAVEPESTEEIDQSSELEEYKNKYFYLAAELDNTNKRFAREKENLLKYGNEKLLKDLLDVVDNFDRTLDAIKGDEDEKVKNIFVGIDMVKKQFLESLKKFGLKEVEALGQTFDPNFHEAVAQESVDDKKEDEIIREYQKGYILNGRLLRASKVVVAK